MKLQNLLPLALDVIEEHLKLELDKEDDAYAVTLRVRAASAEAVVRAQIKVDEQQFRRQQESRIPEMLKRLREEELKLRIA